jgi:hypothetical protein
MRRRLTLVLGTLLSVFVVSQASTPPGKIDTDDFVWLRGAFTDSSIADQDQWKAVKAWGDACIAAHTEAVRKEIEALGAKPTALALQSYGDDSPCALISNARFALPSIKSWAAFEAALREARPVFRGFVHATVLAEKIVQPKENAPLAERLRQAIVGEQILRLGLAWNEGDNAAPQPMSADGARVLYILLWTEIAKRDHANTAMMQAILAKGGWPKISDVGAEAAEDAWLLVQHADDNPAFQLRAQRAMEPLVAKGEVLPKRYAYLADRVTIKLYGTQVYGTQFYCIDGRRRPKGIAGAAAVDAARKSVGLGSLDDAQKDIDKAFGPHC